LHPPERAYRGRFAPSPTGPLHLGSLIAAVASYLDARHHRGEWLVRMEDIDPPREQAGAAETILSSLHRHGLEWDGEVLFQGTRSAAYDEALAQLQASGLLFRCRCTRQQLGPDGCCGGRCASLDDDFEGPVALRVRVAPETVITLDDAVQGHSEWPLGQTHPDFIVRRKDALYAYQLAVAVDDVAQGITHVIRGSDLLDSTPRQVYLMQCLGAEPPHYGHFPVITDADGHKLSKQNHAPALEDDEADANLRLALAFLRQPPPPATARGPAELLRFAAANWALDAVPRVLSLPA
jgi:glutamyl-Q tRNA(Asp) synthetase